MQICSGGSDLFLGTIGAVAQVSTAGISGVVEDSTGAVVPNASITATQTETNYMAKTVSGAAGEFTLTSLPVGPYNLSVTAAGFAPYTQKGLILSGRPGVRRARDPQGRRGIASRWKSRRTRQPCRLRRPQCSPWCPSRSSRRCLSMGGRRTNCSLPFPAYRIQRLNVNPAISTTTGAGTVIPGSISPSTHGVVSGSTYFSLDGANNIDPYAMLGAPFPNPDATQEFNVATSAYSAQYMSAPGGAISVVSKSGTNSIHGSAFEYIRNGFFNADQWGSLNPDELKRNQFGGSIGGPILKNRLFVFGSYQYTLSRTQTRSVRRCQRTGRMGRLTNAQAPSERLLLQLECPARRSRPLCLGRLPASSPPLITFPLLVSAR